MTPSLPTLIVTQAPEHPVGIVLVLHGGQEDSRRRARRTQLAVIRMVPIARGIAARSDRLVVLRLLHRVRGWNGADASPVPDAEWAIAEAHRRYGADLPICLVGHSMGGRTAFRAGGAPSVRTIVGLAPWLPEGEPTAQLAGRRILIVHGLADRTTDPQLSVDFARSLHGRAERVSYVAVPGERHSMLRRRDAFDGLAAGYVAATMAPPSTTPTAAPGAVAHSPGQSEMSPLANILGRAVAGESWLTA